MRCSKCGNEIQQWANGTCYVCQNYKRWHRGKTLKPLHKKLASTGPLPNIGSSSPAKSANKPINSPSPNPAQTKVSHQAKLENIEWFLCDIYHRPKRLSQILLATGMKKEELKRIVPKLSLFVERLYEEWRKWLSRLFPSDAINILVCLYGLDGTRAQDFVDLRHQYRYTYAQLHAMHRNMLKHLQRESNLKKLEAIVEDVARELIK